MEVPKGMHEVIALYGDNKTIEMAHGTCKGDPQWEHDNLVVIRNVCGTGKSIQLHHLVVPSFERCMRKALEACPSYVVRMLGGYCARHQRNDPKNPLSIHSYGSAFDINWDTNPVSNKLITDLPPALVQIFIAEGWEWGGSWVHGYVDPMHFQFAKGC